jgi:hypothetical protein
MPGHVQLQIYVADRSVDTLRGYVRDTEIFNDPTGAELL